MRLATELNVKVTINTYSKRDISWDDIGKAIADPNKGVFFHELYKNQWGHWDYCVSVCPINIYMANSLQSRVIGYPRATIESWFKGITSDDSIYIVKKALKNDL